MQSCQLENWGQPAWGTQLGLKTSLPLVSIIGEAIWCWRGPAQLVGTRNAGEVQGTCPVHHLAVRELLRAPDRSKRKSLFDHKSRFFLFFLFFFFFFTRYQGKVKKFMLICVYSSLIVVPMTRHYNQRWSILLHSSPDQRRLLRFLHFHLQFLDLLRVCYS